MKKRIGILTYHHGYNFGGFAQVFALQTFLSSLPDVEVEVINYYNKTHLYRKHRFLLSRRLFVGFKKVLKFLKAHDNLHLSRFVTSSGIKKLNYDLLVIGSDEVWNFKNPMFGCDLIYFGKDIVAKKKVSYAASFGAVGTSDFLPEMVANQLKKLDVISVRDRNSKEIISKNLQINAQLNIDPTFLIDFDQYGSETINNYIIVYFAGTISDSFKDFILKFAKSKQTKLISLGYNRSWCDENIMVIGPFEWFKYLSGAKYVFTTMFHGTIFSILFKKQFVTELTGYRVNKFNPMLEKLGVSDRLFHEEMNLDDVDHPIDYDRISRIVEKEREITREYFKKILL